MTITAIKLIFLDLDGVLNSARTQKAFATEDKTFLTGQLLTAEVVATIDPVAVGLLNKLIKKTDAKVVISSSHRWLFRKSATSYDMPEVRGYFSDLGVSAGQLNCDILDCTPSLNGESRGFEIDEWIKMFVYNYPNLAIEEYLILDDYEEMLESQEPYYVKTDPNVGISLENYIQACQILGVGPHG